MLLGNVFSERLTGLREEKGLRRQEVADALGISRASLEYYEKGQRKPDIEVAARIAKYYGVSTDYLVGFSSSRVNEEQDQDMKQLCDYLGISNDSLKSLYADLNYTDDKPFLEKALQMHMLHHIAYTAKNYQNCLLKQGECLKTYHDVFKDSSEKQIAYQSYKDAVFQTDFELYRFQTLLISNLKRMCSEEESQIKLLKKNLPDNN